MSLDGAFLHSIKQELIQWNFIGGRVDKIHQPSKEEIVISMRVMSGTKKLMISANPSSARLHVTEQMAENPKSPPMFCMLLRKHIGNAKLIDIRQDGLERILDFYFDCINEMGDMVTNRLVVEIMGRSSNIMLLTKKDGLWRVVDSIKRVTDEISSVRRVLPNVIYQTPPRTERFSLLDFEFNSEKIKQIFEPHQNIKLVKALPLVFEGIAPIFSREGVYYSTRGLDTYVNDLSNDNYDKLLFFLKRSAEALKNGISPVIITEKSGKPIDFCFVNVEQYGSSFIVEKYNSPNLTLDKFFSGKAAIDRIRQRSGDLLKNLLNSYERTARKVESQKLELQNCSEREKYKLWGNIINSNIFNLEKGQSEFCAENYETGLMEIIKLDSRLTPAQNAAKYYSEYRKLDTAEKMLKKLIKDGEQELIYIDSVFDAASRALTDSEITEIKTELSETGYLKIKKSSKKEKQPKSLPPIKFMSSDGFEILVGRNNKQNDKLTLKTALPQDMWLHTQNIAGSHVIIKNKNGNISETAINEAAILAAYCSKARNSGQVPVDYTLVKFVKKPTGAKPGMVIFTNNKTIFVNPLEKIYNDLILKS